MLYLENQLRNFIVSFFSGDTSSFAKIFLILKFFLLFFSNSSHTTPVAFDLPKGTFT